MLLRLLPAETKFNFMGGRTVAIILSGILMVASLGLYGARGLNLGIDFVGGITLQLASDETIDLDGMRDILQGLGLGDVGIQEFGSAIDASDKNEALIRIERQPGDATAQQEAVALVQSSLEQAYDGLAWQRTEVVGPKVSGELARDGALSVGLAVLAVLIYIWLRFEWQFGVGAVAALVHDVILTVGFFSLTQLEFNLSIIAAILTIVGYSLNDTVVVYDRVRETIRRFRKLAMPDLLNRAINDTLARTLMTSITTLLALLALFFFGGAVIQGFTAAMIWGVLVGTYSSIFIASPVLLLLNLKRENLLPDDAKPAT